MTLSSISEAEHLAHESEDLRHVRQVAGSDDFLDDRASTLVGDAPHLRLPASRCSTSCTGRTPES